jgi:hypothetical protein
MLKYACAMLLVLLLASCAQDTVENSNTPSTIRNVDNPGTVLNTNRLSDAPEWIETEINGVDLGVWLPAGWQYDDTAGLTLVERMGSIEAPSATDGIMIYFFVPELASLIDENAEHDNLAYAALHEVSRSPDLTGAAELTRPVKLKWGEMDAAYYTYSAPDAVQGLVLAFAVPSNTQIVVANITAPDGELPRVVEVMPEILNDLRINSQRLGEGAMNDLMALLDAPPREAG